MSLILEHPTALAKEVASLIDADPIMARQLKEHVKPERLLELLEIDAVLLGFEDFDPEKPDAKIRNCLQTLFDEGVAISTILKFYKSEMP